MWYLGSLFILIAFMFSCAIAGTAVCRLLPFRIRPNATLAYAPLLGLALFVLLATLVGWAGAGFRTWVCLPLTIAVLLLSLRLCEHPRTALKGAAGASAFAVVSSIVWFLPIIRFDAFNPYNDTYTYLVHAQWLQTHSFRENIHLSEQSPALTQIAAYQIHGLRMGASFLFGWVQGLFGIEWSYLVYPVAMLLPLIAGTLALAGTAYFVVRKNRMICLLGATALVTTLNGFSFGTANGFLPQTYGIALGFGGLGLLGMYMSCLQRGEPLWFWKLIPEALLLGAMLFCYPEFAPFVALAAAAYLAGEALLHRTRIRAIVRFGVLLSLFVVMLVNLEIIRILRSVVLQANSLVGAPVLWTLSQFLAHAAGLLSGAWEGGHWAFYSPALTQAALLLFLGGSCALLIRYRNRIRLEALAPSLSVAGVSLLAFLYFRYAVASPWGQGEGQTWSQFKLTGWVSMFVIFILVCGLAAAALAPRWVRYAAIAWLLLWQGDGFMLNYKMADLRTRQIRDETGFNDAPFDAYRQVRRSAALVNHESIHLALGAAHSKTREMFTYFWMDRPLVSDWSDDDYLLPLKGNPGMVQPRMWVLQPAIPGPLKPTEQRVGRISLMRSPKARIQQEAVLGGYGEEVDRENNSLQWTARRLSYHYKSTADEPLRLRANFTYLPASAGRQLRILLEDGSARTLQSMDMKPGWTPFVSDPFEVRSSEFSLIFECDQPPTLLGNGDPRRASFLIKNLTLEVIE